MPDFIQPFGFIFCRVSGALLLFWLFAQFTEREKVRPKDLGLLAICGAFGVAANQLMFFYGLNLTSPINAAIILTCNPILVLVISAIVLKERITSRKIVGIGLGLTGALGLILFKGTSALSSDGFVGDLFVFLNATSYAVYLVLVKPLMQKYKPMTVIKWVFLFGFIYVIPFGFTEFQEIDWSGFTTNIWGAFIFVVLGTTFLAYLFNIYGLTELSPSVVSIYIYSQPLIASIMAIALQKDELSYEKIIAAIFIFTGVYLVSSRRSIKKIT
ncbi:MAG: drug/metabolite transporter (DMT)-like permease [Vicingaceae bacterium]|jgi:drug/metabolite transporter (DMT)-like permease